MQFNRALVAVAALGLAAISLGASSGFTPTRFGQIDDARMRNAESEPQNWMLHEANQKAWNYSALDQINAGNVSQLKPAWFLQFDTNREQQATPIVVDGVAYVATGWSKVYAVNAKTGEQLWEYDPKVPGETGPKSCCGIESRGVAVYHGKVYIGTLDGRVVAIDAKSGQLVWETATLDPSTELVNTGAVRIADGLVFIGNAGGEFGGRGFMTAINADTGKIAWRFYLTPGKPGVKDNAPSDEVMAKVVQPTWFGPYNDYRGGANPWGSIVYDPDFDTIYIATGNGYPWNRYFRSDGKGDNLFISSVVAVDAKTGKYKWHYQEVPGEDFDADAVGPITLIDLPTPTGTRKALVHINKNGIFWEIDRKTGKLISGKGFVPGIDFLTGFDKDGKVIMRQDIYYDNLRQPAPVCCAGAHSWQPTAYSPKTGWVYLQASQGPGGTQLPTETFEYVKGLDHIGIYAFGRTIPPEVTARRPAPPTGPQTPRRSYLEAWDPVANKAVWQTDGNGGGVMTTGGNLVFQGTSRNVMGILNAFRADTGEKVWSYNIPNAVTTAPVTYMVDGEQYVLVATGASSGIGATPDERARQPGRLVAFKLNGTATLPADPPPAPPYKAVPADQALNDADYAWASDKYGELCAHCHGINAANNNVIPDLRRSNALPNKDAWSAIVEGGLLNKNGMVSWTRFLPPGGAEKLRLYVAEQARRAIAAPPGGGRGGGAGGLGGTPANQLRARPQPNQSDAPPLHGADPDQAAAPPLHGAD